MLISTVPWYASMRPIPLVLSACTLVVSHAAWSANASVPVSISGSTGAPPSFSCSFDSASSLPLNFSGRPVSDAIPLRIRCTGASESTSARLSLSSIGPCSSFPAYVGPATTGGSSASPSSFTPVRIHLTNNGNSFAGPRLDESDVGKAATSTLNVIAHVRASDGGQSPSGSLYLSNGVSTTSQPNLYLFFGDTYVDPSTQTCGL